MAILFDAAYPGPADPHVDGCLVYVGGNTPHIWTDAQIAAAPGRYRLPVYVRSNPQNADPVGDAAQAIAWLTAHNWPKGKAVVLDLETAIDVAYVTAFGEHLHAAGYLVWPYGSTSTLLHNPAIDGYFESDPTGVPHIRVSDIITQYAFEVAYDLDETNATSELEDTTNPQGAVPDVLDAQDQQWILDNVLKPLQASLGLLEYGDGRDATPQTHPFNLYQIWEQLEALEAAVAKIPTTAEPVSLKGQTATISFS